MACKHGYLARLRRCFWETYSFLRWSWHACVHDNLDHKGPQDGTFRLSCTTVDGSEILHQVIDRLSHSLQAFVHLRRLFGISSINSISVYHFSTGLETLGPLSAHPCDMPYLFHESTRIWTLSTRVRKRGWGGGILKLPKFEEATWLSDIWSLFCGCFSGSILFKEEFYLDPWQQDSDKFHGTMT